MRSVLLLIPVLLFAGCKKRNAPPEEIYSFSADLKDIENSTISVTMQIEGFSRDTAKLVFADYSPRHAHKTLYGELVSDVSAVSSEGETLQTVQKNYNRWDIYPADDIEQITYRVSDFRPGLYASATQKDIKPESNHFERGTGVLFQPAASLAYLDNGRADSVYVELVKPFGLKAVSGNSTLAQNDERVSFSVYSLNELYNSPVLLSNEQALNFSVEKFPVHLGFYAGDGELNPDSLKSVFRTALRTATDYAKLEFPVDRYAWLLYSGAEESHGAFAGFYNSSVIMTGNMDSSPSYEAAFLAPALETFFRIYLPQNIQSEEFRAFDYDTPVPNSQYWMNEGFPAYLTQHALINQRLSDEQAFQRFMESSFRNYRSAPDSLILSRASRNLLEEGNQPDPDHIRAKAIVVSLMLDIELRKESYGQRGLKNLAQYLSRAFNDENTWREEELFEIITAYANHDFIPFYKKYVAGNEPLPVADLLEDVGYQYDPETGRVTKEPYAGQDAIGLRLNWLYGK